MKKYIKTMLAIICAVAMLIVTSVSVYAVTPRYKYINGMTVSLTCNGNNAYCYVTVTGSDDVSGYINGTATLTDENGTVYGNWTNLSMTGDNFHWAQTVLNVPKGHTYTLDFTITANASGRPETISGDCDYVY